jgi:hypothetical protein
MACRHDADIAKYRRLLEDSVDAYPSGFQQSVHIELAICVWLAGDADAVNPSRNSDQRRFSQLAIFLHPTHDFTRTGESREVIPLAWRRAHRTQERPLLRGIWRHLWKQLDP